MLLFEHTHCSKVRGSTSAGTGFAHTSTRPSVRTHRGRHPARSGRPRGARRKVACVMAFLNVQRTFRNVPGHLISDGMRAPRNALQAGRGNGASEARPRRTRRQCKEVGDRASGSLRATGHRSYAVVDSAMVCSVHCPSATSRVAIAEEHGWQHLSTDSQAVASQSGTHIRKI